MIDGVLLGGPLPRGTYLDVAGHSAQVRSLLVLGRFGRKEARLDVERERLDGAAVGSVFGAGEGANLSPGDLLLLYPSPRPSRPRWRSLNAARPLADLACARMGLLGMPVDGHALSFRVRVAQCFDPDGLPSHQNLTTVRRPRTQASSVFRPAALNPRPPGLITYWASNLRFNQPVACQPYQTSSGTSLPPAFRLRAAEFTWVVPTAKPTSSSGRQEKVPVCLRSTETW